MFSVIITCFNEGEDLRRAVESVRRQTFTDYEIIVVKDYSGHKETLKVCRELENEGLKVLYAESNVGVSVTRNMGIAAANGDIVYTVDGDDELPEDALEILSDAFDKNPNADVIFGNYELIEGGNKKIVDCSALVDDKNTLRIAKFFSCGVLPVGQNAARKRVAIDHPSSEKYSFGCQDYEMQIRMLKAGVKFVYTPHVLYTWYRKPTGVNSSKRNAESFDECMYEHRDFVAPYIGKRYLLGLLKSHGNKEEYCRYFRQYAPRWCRWATILPFPLLTKFARFVK